MVSRLTALLSLLPIVSIAVSAQTAKLTITPPHATTHPILPAVFHVTVTPSGGFSAPVYLSVSSPTINTGGALGTAMLDQSTYSTGANITITPGPTDIGTHMILVEGKNGALHIYDTCYLEVTPRTDLAWTNYAPWNSPMPDSTINAILVDRNNVGWMATRHGLARFDRTTAQWAIYDSTNSALPFSRISALAADSSGAIWVGGTRIDSVLPPWDSFGHAVVAQLVDGVWKVYDESNSGLEGKSVYSIAADAKGSIWIGTDTGLVRFDGTTWTPYYQDAPLAPPFNLRGVMSLAVDHDGTLWVVNVPATALMSMEKFDGSYWTPVNLGGQYPWDTKIFIDPHNKLWIISEQMGLGSIESNKLLFRSNNSWLYPGPHPTTMAFSNDGITWLGNAAAGKYPYFGLGASYGNNQWRPYSPATSGLLDGTVRSLGVDSHGVVWIGTASYGLVIYDPSLDDISSVASPAHAAAGSVAATVYPNPAGRSVTIGFRLNAPDRVRIALDDVRGAEVRALLDERREAGEGTITVATAGFPSGLYFVRVTSGGNTDTRPLVIDR